MTVTRINNVDHSLAERRARRDHDGIDRPSLADLQREACRLPFDDPRRVHLLRESARIVRQRQLDAFPPDGPSAA
jgi:hypothetical protein